eukprot:5420238-Prorocentrum_lima.AAC.1
MALIRNIALLKKNRPAVKSYLERSREEPSPRRAGVKIQDMLRSTRLCSVSSAGEDDDGD